MKTIARSRQRFLITLQFILMLLIIHTNLSAQTIRYVRKDAPPGGDGTSWEKAYDELGHALHWARNKQLLEYYRATLVQIWVAKGTYKPMYKYGNLGDADLISRTYTFPLHRKIEIYGGFDGNEQSLEERDWHQNETILSGDIGIPGDKSDNVYSVLTTYLDSDGVVIDGLTIRDGNSDKPYRYDFENTTMTRGSGGGLFVFHSNVRVANSMFLNNSAIYGGAISSDHHSNVDIYNSVFYENHGRNAINCHGGGANIVNTTVIGNSGGGLETGGTINFYNSIIWGNGAGSFTYPSAWRSIKNSLVEGVTSADANGNISGSLDPRIIDLANGNLALTGYSPLINAGNSSHLTGRDAYFDLAKNPRIFGGTIDIGAFEYQNKPSLATRYVREGYSGSGASWQDASGDLQLMINESEEGNEIWVAGGTYKPNRKMTDLEIVSTNSRENAFMLKEGVRIYGGFNGTETTLSQRNFTTNVTRLSGQLDGTNAYHVVMALGRADNPLTAATKLDGFTISSGVANGNELSTVNGQLVVNRNGGGIYSNYASTSFSNINLTGNQAGNMGGAVYNWLGSPVFENLNISGNHAQSGGAVANHSSNPKIYNTRLSGNHATYGGAFFNVYGSLSVSGALITGNTSNYGGAFYNSDSSPEINNATISSNTGHAIYNDSGVNAKIRNTIIYGNDLGVAEGNVAYQNSLVQGVSGGTNGNLDGDMDPMLESIPAPGLTTEGDFGSTACSPVINAGNNSFVPDAISHDFAGNPRLYQGFVDMGAFENQTSIQLGSDRLAVNGEKVSIQTETGKNYRVRVTNEICRSVAMVHSNGTAPVSGEIELITIIDDNVKTHNAAPYVQRHYQINPANNAENATATLTLYFTQPEFTAFNTASSGQLPTHADDATGKSGLRIYQYHGTASGGNGPGAYQGQALTIDPADDKIVWNQALERWEITFDVTGFSGFFVGSASSPLPVKLVSFSAHITDHQTVRLDWNVAEQVDIDKYVVERSLNGKSFEVIGQVLAIDTDKTSYTFEDKSVPDTKACYYRLKMSEIDGSFAMSRIMSVKLKESENKLIAYPMPAQDYVRIKGKGVTGTTLNLLDISGRVISEGKPTSDEYEFNLKSLLTGTYFIRNAAGKTLKILKL